VHIATLEAGLDPSIGYLHTSRPGRLALVYDLMEPFRPLVDRTVLRFVLTQHFTSKDFLLSPTGVCRMHPLLAWKVARLGMNKAVVQLIIDRVLKWLNLGGAHSQNLQKVRIVFRKV